jgi:hypothetical protein
MIDSFPYLELDAQLQPITRTVLRIQLSIRPAFKWMDRAHGSSLRWHIWVEDSANEHIYHREVRRGREEEEGKGRKRAGVFSEGEGFGRARQESS